MNTIFDQFVPAKFDFFHSSTRKLDTAVFKFEFVGDREFSQIEMGIHGRIGRPRLTWKPFENHLEMLSQIRFICNPVLRQGVGVNENVVKMADDRVDVSGIPGASVGLEQAAVFFEIRNRAAELAEEAENREQFDFHWKFPFKARFTFVFVRKYGYRELVYFETLDAKGPDMGTKAANLSRSRELEDVRAVLILLKRILKERGLSYRDLGERLGLSESGIKKIFASSDCSYRRLSQICNVVGVRVVDLLNEIDRAEGKGFEFTERQQTYFLKNMGVFGFFVKLVVERQPIDEIESELRLSKKEIFTYLKKLDELALIQLHRDARVRLPKLSYVRDFGPGPLLETAYQRWGQQLVSDLAHPKFQSSGQFVVRCFKMRDDTYQELLARVLELESEFLRRAVREMSISSRGLKTMRWMSLIDQRSFINAP